MVFQRLVLPRLPFRLFHFSRLSRSRAAFTLPFRFKWDQHDFSLWPTTPMLNVYFDFFICLKILEITWANTLPLAGLTEKANVEWKRNSL